jgi:hypothetical protein
VFIIKVWSDAISDVNKEYLTTNKNWIVNLSICKIDNNNIDDNNIVIKILLMPVDSGDMHRDAKRRLHVSEVDESLILKP